MLDRRQERTPNHLIGISRYVDHCGLSAGMAATRLHRALRKHARRVLTQPRLVPAGKFGTKFVLLEELIEANRDSLFPGMITGKCHRFRVTRDADIRLQTTVSGIPPTLPPRAQGHLLRIVEEAFRNAVHHAAPTEIHLSITHATGGRLRICIADDGCGFDVRAARERAAAGASLGLLGMQERVSLAGGNLVIDSEPGRGTAIVARFPLAAEGQA